MFTVSMCIYIYIIIYIYIYIYLHTLTYTYKPRSLLQGEWDALMTETYELKTCLLQQAP